MPSTTSDRVWYGAYGSNLLEKRFLRYLEGGSYLPGHTEHVGARDSQEPGQMSPLVHGPWSLSFGLSSKRWGGGVAFLEPRLDEGACVRCWDITQEQFMDVAAQENGFQPGEVNIDIDEIIHQGELSIGDTWYSRIIYLGEYRGQPLLTFTSPTPPDPTPPGEPYLSAILNGFMEASPSQKEAHIARLMRARGVAPTWTRDAIARLVKPET
ncbi:MAG: hypothetical protein QF637_03625 [Acidimicrobiales bacterium]|nr:hypothetical protein [Acidimicrobiales bacterium]